MNKLDYKRHDFKEIKTKNKKTYYIKIGKDFIEIPIEIFKLYKADYIKNYRIQKKEIALMQRKYAAEIIVNNQSNIDMDKYYIDLIDKEESINNLYKAIDYLNEDQYYIIYSLFFEEQTELLLARKLNISQQALNKKKKKILLILKKELLRSKKM